MHSLLADSFESISGSIDSFNVYLFFQSPSESSNSSIHFYKEFSNTINEDRQISSELFFKVSYVGRMMRLHKATFRDGISQTDQILILLVYVLKLRLEIAVLMR